MANYLDKEELAREFYPLVRKIAYDLVRSLPPSISVDDLIQEGIIGFLSAIEKFDPQRNLKVSTYVTSRIKGAMLDYLRSMDWMPRTLRKQMKAIEKKRIEKLNEDPQKAPEEVNSEIARELGMEVKDVEMVEREISRDQILSLDKYFFEEEGEENFSSDDEGPDKAFEKQELKTKLEKAIRSLNEREQLILSLYYEEELNFKEISKVLDISESRVCQIHSTALSKIKEMIKEWV
ncbi:FliA/WhiG family RNA polymerase sigma factor [Athalassotoga saccharophila]|uniref:FliA/WhiG family RNA polymerase sigma factor n=1 Tax=Athalassotoga saccharophila TaxID=1441386 RepID=UPI00137A7680|nr:FliA/WhiG family RNA polymerase sigma factor [Athalassotoga saccharophila]BBJ27279.1 RNA polymerase sigma factor FliA [Athalassotoga saccharophila]